MLFDLEKCSEEDIETLAAEMRTGAARMGMQTEEWVKRTGKLCGEEYVETWLEVLRRSKGSKD